MGKFFEKIITFLKEVKIEAKKVNWPTKQQTLRYTLLVVAFSIVAAIFLGGIDFLFSELIRRIISSRP
ncbi:MAG: preprotein translocase subunit SecE [Candidatus Nealsonbacteria bacterium CG08_land_8_20_14_0_20_43_11]|uniref:Protein translocase subunit SecE n=1 Tax=Candidatus Nealsonbacteria bacterium CG08_land_8_20_14_0_20_43_11 TaxID=1974706 RepID=A0A2M6T0T2_9BACT|nr:MAG: preprotein translocase subunit SecE [Candidatus Nealsonbacteria bacterium CG08_land_8_20_14_0_20_43_11]